MGNSLGSHGVGYTWYEFGTNLVRLWYESGTTLVRLWYESSTTLVRL
jgi:hypothetical protein